MPEDEEEKADKKGEEFKLPTATPSKVVPPPVESKPAEVEEERPEPAAPTPTPGAAPPPGEERRPRPGPEGVT